MRIMRKPKRMSFKSVSMTNLHCVTHDSFSEVTCVQNVNDLLTRVASLTKYIEGVRWSGRFDEAALGKVGSP